MKYDPRRYHISFLVATSCAKKITLQKSCCALLAHGFWQLAGKCRRIEAMVRWVMIGTRGWWYKLFWYSPGSQGFRPMPTGYVYSADVLYFCYKMPICLCYCSFDIYIYIIIHWCIHECMYSPVNWHSHEKSPVATVVTVKFWNYMGHGFLEAHC